MMSVAESAAMDEFLAGVFAECDRLDCEAEEDAAAEAVAAEREHDLTADQLQMAAEIDDRAARAAMNEAAERAEAADEAAEEALVVVYGNGVIDANICEEDWLNK